ncbi:hypothetical protein [Neptuniibacter sp.]|uniref:hypothetical protein n=1 Tax=Neptuniibacter sp. TaxID=1962643 RepID=UPI00262B506C|nr:hypothetical protein [Neptuniibacter sp.]MCP4597032.1 hypothetical protein [Neptuniibacter sp.]
MWTSADDNRKAYVKALEKLIVKHAGSLANDSDMKQKIDGKLVSCAHILFDELKEEAVTISQKKNVG